MGAIGGVDGDYLADAYFSVVQGRRYTNRKELHDSGKFELTATALCYEATKAFTAWYFAFAVKTDSEYGLPKMLDLWNMFYSPVFCIMCNLDEVTNFEDLTGEK